METRRQKRRGFFKILCILMLIAAAILAVAMAVASQREGGLRQVWRDLRGEVDTDEFFFENASGGAFADIDNGLAVAATSGLYVYDREGDESFTRLYAWNHPAVTSAGSYGAAWDVGGDLVLFFDSKRVIAELKTENPVVSVRINSLGYLTVCTQGSDYMGAATVYNSLGTAIYRWSSGSGRVLSASVRERDELMVLTVGSGGSRLVLMRLDNESLLADRSVPGLVIDAAFTDSGAALVTTTGILGLDGDLNDSWSYSYSGRYLESFHIAGDALMIALTDFQVGGRRTVVTLSASGAVLGSLELEGDMTDLAISQNRAAILTSDALTVYGRDLADPRTFACDFGAERVMIRQDGTVLCAGTFSAYVYGEK